MDGLSSTSSSLRRTSTEEPPLPVHLHPLVVLNVTHHATRIPCPTPGADTFGILLGRTASDGGTDIITSYEAVRCETDSDAVDWAAVRLKHERLAEVSPELSVVGWYGVGGDVGAAVRCSRAMHAALCETFGDVAGGPLFGLVLDVAPPGELASLPVHLFEAALLREGGCQSGGKIVVPVTDHPRIAVALTKIRFILESDEMEQVGVDAAMRTNDATTAPQRRRIEQSLRLLRQRIALAANYLAAVEDGRIAQPDYAALRHIAKVCAALPSPGESGAVVAASAVAVQQSLLTALLSLQTKSALAMSELANAQRQQSWRRTEQ